MCDSKAMLGLHEPLATLVTRKFREAYKAKGIIFSETSLTVLRSRQHVPFQLRYCPALAKKPVDKEVEQEKKDSEAPRPRFNPFENPASELRIAEVPHDNESHVLVLNKYPVIHNHFIITTKLNKPQTALLEEDDLAMTYACLRAWGDDKPDRLSGRLFSFFNSGEHSGASQPHRHLQFLPVEDMLAGGEEGFQLLIDRMSARAHSKLSLYHDPSLSFLHFATPLEDGISPAELHEKYRMLLQAALSAARYPGQPFRDDLLLEENGLTVLSYNLAMTKDKMAICPRNKEGAGIPGAGQDSFVAINGTILGGTLMVKDQQDWDRLRRGESSLLDDLLLTLGFPMFSWADSATGTSKILNRDPADREAML